MKRCISIVCVVLVLCLGANTFVSAQEQQVPDEITKALEYYSGTWEVTGTLGNDSIKGRANFRVPAGGHCSLGTVTFRAAGETSRFSLVSGWDSSTGWITEQGAGSDGGIYTVKWKKVSENVEEGTLTGTVNGKEMTENVKLERKGKDEVVVTCTERKIGDESAPDVTLIYKRMSEAEKNAAKRDPASKKLPPRPQSVEAGVGDKKKKQ